MKWLDKLLKRKSISPFSYPGEDDTCRFCSVGIKESKYNEIFKRCAQTGVTWEQFVRNAVDIMLGILNDEYVLVRGPNHPEGEKHPFCPPKGPPSLRVIEGGKV